MKKILFCILFFSCFNVFSQEDAWVYFNVKNNAQAYYDNTLNMLSQRALDRRSIQNIALDSKDIPIDKSFISQIKSVSGITVMAKSKWLNALHIRGTQAVINSLKSLAFVEKVDFADKTLNTTAKKTVLAKTKSVSKVLETQVNFAYGSSANQIQMLHGDVLHQQNYTGSGKIIAVMDAGFPGVNTAQPFQRLRDNGQILGGYDFVGRNTDFYAGDSHGAMVLSCMGGYKENKLVGTAPDASYYLFRTEDASSENPVEESYWVEAAEKADSLGVDIINTSLGYFGFDNTAYDHTYKEMDGKTAFMTRGAEIAFSRGMIVVVSAGNEGDTENPHIGVPADGISVLTVGAVTPAKVVTSFSSIGLSFDGRVKPDVMAQGQSAVLSDSDGTIGTADGTSFSSPITAGMAACLWQAFPNKTNAEIKEMIIQSADRYTAPNAQYGYGIPDFSLALSNALGLNDFSQKNVFLYPNPTNNISTVSLPDNFDTGIFQVYSVLGQKISEQVITRTQPLVSLKALNAGTYIYTINWEGNMTSGKLIKQ
ncbi:S8 family serine peptidase [Flavobacterium aquicola]|uniref:Putative secreted protein (Por secretion system target) n=1 Tax=Flavobacterium aquicola TaxID=1682742 RepID=A0A3E0EVW8_9FLAO|nr:S8 family serine peptidase [Flavobacterium aquicola]REH01984.1 putative secreted protein (Por secretion system target) [Flavobacterium aquicola]